MQVSLSLWMCVCVRVFTFKLQASQRHAGKHCLRGGRTTLRPAPAASTLAATAAYLHFDWETVEAHSDVAAFVGVV